MKKNKYKAYAVWVGRNTGVYTTWPEVKALVDFYPGSKYKGFPTFEEALQAFKKPWYQYYGQKDKHNVSTATNIPDTIKDYIAVDGAWSPHTLFCEFQGKIMPGGKILFKCGPYPDGTNNIAEFLAITTALQQCQRDGNTLPIYSDSTVAIGWVRNKESRSLCPATPKNKELLQSVRDAVTWLNENEYENQVLQWQTRLWGQIPADYGRKY